jgi:glycine cleavage system transcriptional repressor
MANEFFVLTAVGPDRPGLLNAISDYVFRHGGNVESSRAATLGGEFAVVMLVAVDAAGAAAMESQVGELSRAGLTCTVRRTSPPHAPAAAGASYTLTVQAMDHPGIVQAVTHELAAMGANIESLETQVESAPHTGTAIFHFQARVMLPQGLTPAVCRKRLDDLARRFNFDIALTEEAKTGA